MSRKSWDKGYDFEKGRQAHRDEKKIEAGLGNFFERLGSGAIGGILFIFFVLLCLGSVVWDAIDQSDEIVVEKRKNIQHKIVEWIEKTNSYSHWWNFCLLHCTVKESSILVTARCECGESGLIGLILHSADAGDNWEIVWRSDKNEYADIRGWPKDVSIISEDEMSISFSGTRENMYSDELKEFKLYTFDGGETWKFTRVF